MSKRKCSSMSWPCAVWSTSGWNCTPQSARSTSSKAAISAPAERAVTVKPAGATTTASPWLIHTDCVGRQPGEQHRPRVADLELRAAELGQAGARDGAAQASAMAWKP